MFFLACEPHKFDLVPLLCVVILSSQELPRPSADGIISLALALSADSELNVKPSHFTVETIVRYRASDNCNSWLTVNYQMI